MSDEPVIPEPVVPEVVPEVVEPEVPQTVETPTPEGAVETAVPVAGESPEPPPEGTAEIPAESPDDQFFFREKVDGQEVVWDIRDPEQRKQLSANARQGFHYSKKLQALSEAEKANEGWTQLGRAAVSNPAFLQAMMAEKLGYGPEVLYGPTQPPPDWMREQDPNAYADALASHKESIRARAIIDRSVETYLGQVSSSTNQILFDRVKLQQELSDAEAKTLRQYVEAKIKPNNLGVFEAQDVENAYWALFGRQRMASEKLKTSEQIKKTIQQAATPQSATSVKPERLTKKQKEDRGFVDYVRENAA